MSPKIHLGASFCLQRRLFFMLFLIDSVVTTGITFFSE